MRQLPSNCVIENEISPGGIELFWVVEYNHQTRIRTYLSVHHTHDEAEEQLAFAKKGQHICQTNPAGTLWKMK